MRADRLAGVVIVVAAVAGLAISAYLSAVHAAQASLVCGIQGPVDCERVLTSPYAELPGSTIPTAAAGLLWFGVSGLLAVLQLARPAARMLAAAGLAWSVLGLLTVLALVYVEIVQLGAICAWCTGAHVLVLLTLLLALVRWEHRSELGLA